MPCDGCSVLTRRKFYFVIDIKTFYTGCEVAVEKALGRCLCKEINLSWYFLIGPMTNHCNALSTLGLINMDNDSFG